MATPPNRRMRSLTVDRLTIGTTEVVTALLLASGQVVDINGEADGLVLDADADTSISAPTDDQIDFELKSVDHVVMKSVAVANAGTTTNIVEVAMTSPVDTTGTNVHNALNIDIEIGNASGGTNNVRAIAIDDITGDAQVTSTAILTGAGFDLGLDVQGTRIDLDADNDTSIIASTDDTIDIEVNGANDFQITANTFTALSGSTIATNTIAETTAANGVDIDGLKVKDNTLTAWKYALVTKTGNYTVTVAESGTIFIAGAADLVFTLPATAPGLRFGFIIDAAGLSAGTGLSISPNAVDKLMGNGFTSADDKDAICAGSGDREGDNLYAIGDNVGAGWYVTVQGTWTRQA